MAVVSRNHWRLKDNDKKGPEEYNNLDNLSFCFNIVKQAQTKQKQNELFNHLFSL